MCIRDSPWCIREAFPDASGKPSLMHQRSLLWCIREAFSDASEKHVVDAFLKPQRSVFYASVCAFQVVGRDYGCPPKATQDNEMSRIAIHECEKPKARAQAHFEKSLVLQGGMLPFFGQATFGDVFSLKLNKHHCPELQSMSAKNQRQEHKHFLRIPLYYKGGCCHFLDKRFLVMYFL